MRPNTVKQLWRENKPAFGAWLASCSTFAAEQMGSAGFDWLVVDGGHSPVDLMSMVQKFQALSVGDSMPMARARADWVEPGLASIRTSTPNWPGVIWTAPMAPAKSVNMRSWARRN